MHDKKAKHVKATWAKRCNVLLFISSQYDPTLPTVNVHVEEGRNHLWDKSKAGFKYAYQHHLDEADWFMKADDDTYVILENLRYFLSDKNSSDPVYYGCRFRPYVKQGYMSGGAGYVLSKEALRRLIEIGLSEQNANPCPKGGSSGHEDVDIGQCMEDLNVTAGDTRDKFGRGRFFPFVPEHHIVPGNLDTNFWYWKYIYYPVDQVYFILLNFFFHIIFVF